MYLLVKEVKRLGQRRAVVLAARQSPERRRRHVVADRQALRRDTADGT
jgi:hypothetical protein